MSQQRHPSEDFFVPVLTFVLIAGASAALWFFASDWLMHILRWIRVVEMWIVEWIVGVDHKIIFQGQEMTIENWRQYFLKAHRLDLRPEFFPPVTRLVMEPLRLVISALIAIMMLIVMFFGTGAKYRRRLSLDGLIGEQAKSFRTIAPFVKFNPHKLPARAPGSPVPKKMPIFAEALSPEEWMVHHQVKINQHQLEPAGAKRALKKQLGSRWQGPEKLPVHAQGLYAAFALKHVRKRDESEALLEEMALAWSHDKGFKPDGKLKSKIRKYIKNPKIGGKIRPYADQHAWQTTALLRCLQRARDEGGVLQPALFLWIRAHDRALWYPLNNLGRKSYHAEAVGAMVHYTHELIAEQKIPTPRFDDIITGMNTYLKENITMEMPPLEGAA